MSSRSVYDIASCICIVVCCALIFRRFTIALVSLEQLIKQMKLVAATDTKRV